MKKLEIVEVPIPPLETQRWFNRLQENAREVQSIRASTAKDVDALMPALLHEVFKGMLEAA